MSLRLQTGPPARISLGVIPPRLFALLFALSLLFGPLAMERAMAAPPASSHAQMTDDGHCQPDGAADEATPEPCCAAMCAAAAVVPEAAASAAPLSRLAASPSSPGFYRGVLSETSTPPPRTASIAK